MRKEEERREKRKKRKRKERRKKSRGMREGCSVVGYEGSGRVGTG